jgi:hypothetical protein
MYACLCHPISIRPLCLVRSRILKYIHLKACWITVGEGDATREEETTASQPSVDRASRSDTNAKNLGLQRFSRRSILLPQSTKERRL